MNHSEKPGTTTHFGYQQVPVEEKEKRVAGVFHSVAAKYDLMNDLMSFGIHRMLRVGRDNLTNKGVVGNLEYVQANAECLPFPDNHFDCITIAFGLRNVTDKDAALRSMYRVLKPGGRLLVLEFSKPTVPGLNKLYDAYSFTLLPLMGKLVTNDADSYRYLAESIRMHHCSPRWRPPSTTISGWTRKPSNGSAACRAR